jgi:hypothetical protein
MPWQLVMSATCAPTLQGHSFCTVMVDGRHVTFGVCWLSRPLFRSIAELMNAFVVNKKLLHVSPKLSAKAWQLPERYSPYRRCNPQAHITPR